MKLTGSDVAETAQASHVTSGPRWNSPDRFSLDPPMGQV
jgi:hypothetical protein